MISLYSEPRAKRGAALFPRKSSYSQQSGLIVGNDGANGDKLADGYQMLEELGSM
jgi:hypothetical protein